MLIRFVRWRASSGNEKGDGVRKIEDLNPSSETPKSLPSDLAKIKGEKRENGLRELQGHPHPTPPTKSIFFYHNHFDLTQPVQKGVNYRHKIESPHPFSNSLHCCSDSTQPPLANLSFLNTKKHPNVTDENQNKIKEKSNSILTTQPKKGPPPKKKRKIYLPPQA